MKKLLIHCIALASLLINVACTEQDPRCTRLPSGGRFCLQPTTALAAFDAQQIVEASFNGRKETLIIEMESGAEGLRLAGLTPFGHKILQIHYDNNTTIATTSPNVNIDPVLMISLLQLTLWPADAVRKGLDVEMILEESGNSRRILYRNETILTATRTGTKPPYDQIRLIIPSVKLEIDIRSLSVPQNTGQEP